MRYALVILRLCLTSQCEVSSLSRKSLTNEVVVTFVVFGSDHHHNSSMGSRFSLSKYKLKKGGPPWRSGHSSSWLGWFSSTLAFIKVFSKVLWRFSVCPCLWVVRTWPHFVDLQDVNISWNTWGFKDSSVSLWYAVWYILIYHQHPCPSLSTLIGNCKMPEPTLFNCTA